MKKLQVQFVAMAVLHIQDDQHSDAIARAIMHSDLAELGYKGLTPERTINAQLRKLRTQFKQGTYQAHFRLADPSRALDEPEVRLALLALSKQKPMNVLHSLDIVEVTFLGDELMAVRNVHSLRTEDSPRILKVLLPEKISREELEHELTEQRRASCTASASE